MSIKLHMAVQTVAASTRAAFYGLALIWLLLFLVPIITVAGKLSHPELPAKTWQGESRTAEGSVSGASYRGLLWFIWGSSEISYHFKIENDPTVYHGVANIPFTYFSSGELTVVYNPADPSQNFLKILP